MYLFEAPIYDRTVELFMVIGSVTGCLQHHSKKLDGEDSAAVYISLGVYQALGIAFYYYYYYYYSTFEKSRSRTDREKG